MTSARLLILPLVQIGKHRLKQGRKIFKFNMNLAYQGFSFLYSGEIKDALVH